MTSDRSAKTIDPRGVDESVYFYTLHKCASSLFGRYVLKNVTGLTHVNFATQIYRGESVHDLRFEERGFVYGPIRIVTDSASPEFSKVAATLFSPDFVRDKKAVFLIRDPRDIIVSAYYWRLNNPGVSRAPEIAQRQRQIRETISHQTIDEYAIEHAQRLRARFEIIGELIVAAERRVVLKYEDMISNWDKFAADLTRYLDLTPAVLEEVHRRSRPRSEEEQSAHHRSGKTGKFREKLLPATTERITETLAAVLKRFEYEM